jgi:hypothetical protein
VTRCHVQGCGRSVPIGATAIRSAVDGEFHESRIERACSVRARSNCRRKWPALGVLRMNPDAPHRCVIHVNVDEDNVGAFAHDLG